MATIFGDIKPLRNNLIVRNIEKGERKTKGGIILRNDDGQEHGIRPRWAQVYRVGSAISDAYAEHGWKSKFAKIGLPDKYVPTGEYSFVLDEVGLNSESVFKSIKKLIG